MISIYIDTVFNYDLLFGFVSRDSHLLVDGRRADGTFFNVEYDPSSLLLKANTESFSVVSYHIWLRRVEMGCEFCAIAILLRRR